MKRIAPFTVLGMALLAMPVVAQRHGDAAVTHGTLAFDAKASLGAFTGVTDSVTGSITGATELASVRGVVEARTATLSTHNGHRDRDMAKSLEIDKYPTMRFDLDSVSPGTTEGDSTAVTLYGTFTIHGTTRPATVEGWTWRTGGMVRFRGRTPMDVKDYGIGGLKKMLGILSMNEHIEVRIDVTFGD